MSAYDFGTQYRVIASGRIGKVVDSTRTTVNLEFRDKDFSNPEEEEFKKREVEIAEDRSVKASDLAKFVKGKLSFYDLTDHTNIAPSVVISDPAPYKLTVRDLLNGLIAYGEKPYIEIYKWVSALMKYDDDISFINESRGKIRDKVTDDDILFIAYTAFDRYIWDYDDDEELAQMELDELTEQLKAWIDSKGKVYPLPVIRDVAEQFDCDDIDNESAATQKLFRDCLNKLCDMKDPKAIQRRGYCYYCGTKVYPNDWIKARDAFIEYYNLTGDASAANTLGYIYYYGRCNNGVPEYEEAFKYFSIGHAFTYFESTYKLADMFVHGYGVVKDGETAHNLYWSVYKQTIDHFMNEDYGNKFADAALRMGNCYRYGYGVHINLETAYYYYLQADLAIRKRTEAVNYYGDTVVFNGVQRALEETRQEFTTKKRKVYFNYPGWTRWSLIDHRRCKMKIRELKDGELSLTISPMKRRVEAKAPLMLITVPQADYCDLKDKITIRTAKNTIFTTRSFDHEIVFDSIDFKDGNETTFYLNDTVTGKITTQYYSFTAPSPKKTVREGKLFHFVRIVFDESGRAYDYLCDDGSVKAGDQVIIKGYNGEQAVNVVSVFDKYESELGLPAERYKKVIRKV